MFFAGLVSFFMDISSEMVYSLVPLFLAGVLGVTGSVIGLIEGVAESTASLLKLLSGWLSDRLGRRKALMGAGYGISTLSRVLLGLANSWGMVLSSRFVDRFGKGIRTAPRDAIVAESSTFADLGRNFGFHRAMDQFGAVLGPGIAALVLWLAPAEYRLVFWLSLIPGVAAVLVVIFFIRETRSAPRVATPAPPLGARPSLRQRLGRLRGPLLPYILITGLFSLGNSSDAFLILRASGDLGVATALVPVLYLVFNLVYSGLSIPAGLLADRVGRRQVALLGYGVFAVAYAGMALADSESAAWGLFVLYGVYMGLSDGNGRALLAELAPPDRRGTAFGLYHSVVGIVALPASVVAGILWDTVSHAAPFWFGAAGAVAAGLLLLVFVPARPRPVAVS